MRYRATNIITATVMDCLATAAGSSFATTTGIKPLRSAHRRTDQDLAKGFVLQECQVLRQLTGIEVVKEQRHFPLFGHRWNALGHLSLPFIGRSGRDKEKHKACIW